MTDPRGIRTAAILFALLLVPWAVGAQFPRPEPEVERTLDAIVVEAVQRRDSLEASVCESFDLIDKHFRSQFDWFGISQSILREHWPADPAQQQRFVDAFYDHLVEKYGDLVVHFNAETFELERLEAPPLIDTVWLQMQVTMNDGERVPVGLRMRFIEDDWRIINVRADTHNYARGFHDEFRPEISRVGLDGVTERLEEEAGPLRACGQ